MNVTAELQELIKGLRKDGATTGISTTSDLNFYYLEPRAKATYPIFFPLLQSTPRVFNSFNGTRVGGLGVNWKQVTSLDKGGWVGLPEGSRGVNFGMTTKNQFSPFRFIGKDGFVTFAAQESGLGFDDNLALGQQSQLHALLIQEEMMLLFGNSGVAGNGYQLGTSPTPANVTAVATGGLIPTATKVSLYCVALTPYGNLQSAPSPTGVALPTTMVAADGSTFVQNGGTAAISAASAIVTTASNIASVTATVAAINGATGYAWFVDYTDAVTPATSNAFFYGVTSVPAVTVTSVVSTGQKANASTAAGNLTTDNSANALDFDGVLTSGFASAASALNSYVFDCGGAALTADGIGGIVEFESAIYAAWKNYKISYDCIYIASNLAKSVQLAVQTSTSTNGSSRIVFDTNAQGNITAGGFVTGYHSKFSTSLESKVLPVKVHPYLPDGTVLFDVTRNPYPAAGDAIPAVRRIVTLEDHFSIKWPYRGLKHEFGVYAFLTAQHYLPWGIAIIKGAAGQ